VKRSEDLISLACIAVLTVLVYLPTLRNGFLPLGFDDALILDTPAIRALSWPNLRTIATEHGHALYVPLTTLSFAFDYHFWGLNAVGYHLTNVVLQVVAALLVYAFVRPLVQSPLTAFVAAAIFAVHPLQMEAVAIAAQRKTVLSGVLFFLTLILYQHWRRTRGWPWYVMSVMVYGAAVLAKPVMMLPVLLVLYDYVFDGGRVRVVEKLPYLVAAAGIGVVTVAVHAGVGAIQPPHGGSVWTNLLMVSRVTLEHVDAAFLPLNRAPLYYYPKAVVYAPLNFLALGVIVLGCTYVAVHRRRYRWTFFCWGWFLLTLFPESNLIQLAELRADRFLYLPLVGFGLWIAVGLERFGAASFAGGRWWAATRLAGLTLLGAFAMICYRSAGVWHDDVSAWTQVVERHAWSAVAHDMLGRAYYTQDDSVSAAREFATAVRLSDGLADAHLYLARVSAERGDRVQAQAEVHRFLELAPGDAEGEALLAALVSADGT